MQPFVGQDAWAQRALELRAEEESGYARFVAKWADGDESHPKIEATVDSRVLVMTFPEPVEINLDAILEALPNWVALARLDPDQQTARFALREQHTRLHLSQSIDLSAIDLLLEDDETDPPDVVSPLVAIREAAEEAKRIAEIPPPVDFVNGLEVRASDAGGRSRIAFYWPEEVEFEETNTDKVLSLKFNRRAEPDVARLRIEPPPFVKTVTFENDDKGMLFNFELDTRVATTIYRDGNSVILDLASQAAIDRAKEIERQREEAKRALEEARIARENALQQAAKDAAAAAEAAAEAAKGVRDLPLADDASDLANVSDAIASEPLEAPEKVTFGSSTNAIGLSREIGKPETAGPVDLRPEPVDEGVIEHEPGSRESFYRSGWATPAPPDGVVKAKIQSTPESLRLTVPFFSPAPAAVFARPPATWVIFGADADITFNKENLPVRYKIDVIRKDSAVLLRVEAPEGMVPSARSDESTWTIDFAPAAVQPSRFLKPAREVSETGRRSIQTQLIGAAGVVWFEDPVVGDEIGAVIAFGPSIASTTPRMFVEAEMPATAHGLAVIPHADDVTLMLDEETVIINASKGMAISAANAQTVSAYQSLKTDTPTPGFIDFDAWGGTMGNAFFVRQSQLARAAAERDFASKAGAEVLMDLARFYIGHDLGAEAMGVLDTALDGRPLLEQDAAFLSLRAASNVMLERYELAEDDLSKGALRGDKSAFIWRGLTAARMGQWERANDFFSQGEELIFAYSSRWASRFYAVAAEAALRAGEMDRARQMAERAAGSSYTEPSEEGTLILARLSEIQGDTELAYKRYISLTQDASEPVAVKAELRRLDLGVRMGDIAPSEAADELEALRFRWRGDDTEMATVGILADQYMRLGRFREALLLVQTGAIRDPNAPGARELRLRLVDYFRRLYLEGEAERLDPIQALALFYEFKGLTPIGPDGDRMIRKLARRLVAFDLLDPATELLQHQVESRVRGQGKAVIAVDLASIYLMDRQPDRALAAIAVSRQPRLPKALALQRRLLEAAAYRDMGRHDHAIELLEGVEGLEAASIRADAYWNSEQWQKASTALASMLPQAASATQRDADLALKTAIAARMAKQMGLLAQLNDGYSNLFEGTANEQSFELITSQTDITGAALSEAVRRLADAPRVDAFASSLKKRFDAEGES